jgi:hypothetical protein
VEVNVRRVVSALVASLLGCGGQGGVPVGTETGPCYPNGTCNDGLSCLSDLCVRVAIGDGGTDGAGDGAFHPAPHPRLPQVANLGGPVLATPRVQPILYLADTGGPDVEAFVAQLAADSYWNATTAEYGVGALQVLPSIRISTPPPTMISDDMLQATLAANTAGTNPS